MDVYLKQTARGFQLKSLKKAQHTFGSVLHTLLLVPLVVGAQAQDLIKDIGRRTNLVVHFSLTYETSWATSSITTFLRSALTFQVCKRIASVKREHLPDDFLPPPPIQTSLPLSESDQGNFGRELPLLGVVFSCLPACLVSVVRPPFVFFCYISRYTVLQYQREDKDFDELYTVQAFHHTQCCLAARIRRCCCCWACWRARARSRSVAPHSPPPLLAHSPNATPPRVTRPARRGCSPRARRRRPVAA